MGARPGGEAHLDSFFGGVGPWQAPYSTPLLHHPGAKCTWPQVHFSLLHPPPPLWSLDPIMPSTCAACRKRTWHDRWLCGGMLPDFLIRPRLRGRHARGSMVCGLHVAGFFLLRTRLRGRHARGSAFWGSEEEQVVFLSPVSAYGRRQRCLRP